MANDNGGSATVLLAFIAGAIGGAALALLYAPASGRETREYLGDKAREGREKVNAAIDHGREAYERARSEQA